MSEIIKVPNIGDFKSVEIIEVLVKNGEDIKKGDPLITLESDKSSVEVPSPLSGKILNICLLYTSPSPRDPSISRMPSSA